MLNFQTEKGEEQGNGRGAECLSEDRGPVPPPPLSILVITAASAASVLKFYSLYRLLVP